MKNISIVAEMKEEENKNKNNGVKHLEMKI